MRITILAAASINIRDALNSLLPGNVIRAFESVEEMQEFTLNSTLKTDVLLVEDYGVAKTLNNLNEAFMTLANIFDYRFFKTKRVIFLNKPDNEAWLDYYKYLSEELEEQDVEVNISTKRHNISDVKNMILELNKEYKTIKANDVVVVQKARSDELVTTEMIEDDGNDVGVITTLPQYNRDRAKAPFRNNTEPLDISDTFEEIPNIIIEEDFVVEAPQLQKDKYIVITGVENSGVSTTTFIIGKGAADYGKVLLIDLDVHNMGLSYLSDKVYSKLDQVHILKLEEVYTKSFDNLVEQTMNGDALHILTISLKLIKKVGDIEFTLINFIEKIQERYDYIVFDTSLRVIKYYPTLLGSYADRIIMTCVPYMNKLVSALKQVEGSSIIHMKAFRESKIAAFSVGMSDRNGLKPVNRDVCRKYSKSILGMDIPFSGIYVLQSGGYHKPKFFEDIMNITERKPAEEVNSQPQPFDESSKDIIEESAKEVDEMIGHSQNDFKASRKEQRVKFKKNRKE